MLGPFPHHSKSHFATTYPGEHSVVVLLSYWREIYVRVGSGYLLCILLCL